MTIITTNEELNNICKKLSTCQFITVDTEFVREKTYYAILCLIQISGPDKQAYAIDVLAHDEKLDLKPLWDLMINPNILKVFHAARQDLEIIYQLSNILPTPLYDTQIAAMVCGYGDQVGYEALVSDICKEKVDKSSQFTDWSHRPLTPKQINYALGDVIHLIDVYNNLNDRLAEKGRSHWVVEEMLNLLNKDIYDISPHDAWRRLKLRNPKSRDLAVLREIAAWRESEAQRKNVPRGRILKDETILDLTYQKPTNEEDIIRIRGITADIAKGRIGKGIIDAINIGIKISDEDCPKVDVKQPISPKLVPAVEMLKMLLRLQSIEHNVAAKLIASSDDIDDFVTNPNNKNLIINQGWRYEVFGIHAHEMLKGNIALTLDNNKIKVMIMK